MDVDFYATKTYVMVLKQREETEKAYDLHSEVISFWAFIDLRNSTNYRIERGPKKGYVRAETFFSIIHRVIEPAQEVRLIKEIGDAVMLACSSFTPLFECLLLIDQISHMIATLEEGESIPFGVRIGINSGPAKRLIRDREDFLGRPIDELSRVMRMDSSRTNILIHDGAYKVARDLLADYSAFLIVGDALMVPAAVAKHVSEPILYRELVVRRGPLEKFRESFSAWRRPAAKDASSPEL